MSTGRTVGVSMLAGYVLDDEGGGDVRAKRGFLLVDGDGF
jgi:hypothetical protein